MGDGEEGLRRQARHTEGNDEAHTKGKGKRPAEGVELRLDGGITVHGEEAADDDDSGGGAAQSSRRVRASAQEVLL
jgi:hypothetical protein